MRPRTARTAPARPGSTAVARGRNATVAFRRTARDDDWRRPPAVGSRGALGHSTLWDDGDGVSETRRGPQPLRARWDPVPPPRTRVGRPRTRAQRRRSTVGWFIHHYGWRAYALPVLAALTVTTVVSLVNSTGSGARSAGSSASAGTAVTVTVGNAPPTTVTVSGPGVTTTVGPSGDTAPDGPRGAAALTQAPTAIVEEARVATALPVAPDIAASQAFDGVVMAVLPPGADFAKTGSGTYHVVPGTSKPFGTGPERRTFTVEVENGIESASAEKQFADSVVAILSSPRSWIGGGQFTLQRIDSGTPDFRISLTSQMTTRRADFCGWDIPFEASCFNHSLERVVINDARWMRGAYSYDDDLASYRVYAINHEVGHALGRQHEPCSATGALAPVMMQQSWSTSDDDLARLNPGGPVSADGNVCRASPFVYPPTNG